LQFSSLFEPYSRFAVEIQNIRARRTAKRVRIGDIMSSFLSFFVLSSVGSQSFFATKESKSWCEFSRSNTHALREQIESAFWFELKSQKSF